MDVVYVLGTGSMLRDIELRFSLRSIEKFLTGFDKVYIVGEFPSWVQNAIHIPLADNSSLSPDHNIMRKVTAACENSAISSDFLFFNDDHYLLESFDAPTFPNFYQGDLSEYCRLRGMDPYGKRAKNTLNSLISVSASVKYFDVHTPIIYNKEHFLRLVTAAPGWNGEGYVIKSLYGNLLNLPSTPFKDQKKNEVPPAGIRIFSTFPHIKAAVTRFLQETFPEISRFEKTGF